MGHCTLSSDLLAKKIIKNCLAGNGIKVEKIKTDVTHGHVSVELILSVEDHNNEGAAWYMLPRPLHLHAVVSGFRWIILAQDRSVLLRFPLHFHSEGTCWFSHTLFRVHSLVLFLKILNCTINTVYVVVSNFSFYLWLLMPDSLHIYIPLGPLILTVS